MACRTCASAQSTALPSSPASVAEAPDAKSATATDDPVASCMRTVLSLAVQAMDELRYLQDAQLPRDCVESLVNTELHHRIESADTAIKSVHDALSRCGDE